MGLAAGAEQLTWSSRSRRRSTGRWASSSRGTAAGRRGGCRTSRRAQCCRTAGKRRRVRSTPSCRSCAFAAAALSTYSRDPRSASRAEQVHSNTAYAYRNRNVTHALELELKRIGRHAKTCVTLLLRSGSNSNYCAT